MAVYGNVYYPDSRNSTWSSISTLTWADSDYNWASFGANTANATASWSYTTTATDLGSYKSFYPTTEVVWDSQQPVTIQYEYSTDGNTYVTANAEPMSGRYIRTKITTTGAWLSSINTIINTDTKTETYYNLNTATLSGNVNYRTVNTQNFSSIQSLVVTPTASETKSISGRLIDNTGNIKIRIIDLDTWGKTAVDANVNIVVVGFPRLIANSTLGTVTVSVI